MSRPFHFKQFSIFQDRCAMKVGTDGVLLGAVAGHESPKTALDIGSGTGLIPLMLAQRFPDITVHGVEIEKQAFLQSVENIEASPWPGRIKIHHAALRNFRPPLPYDIITCNPPYFSGTTLPYEKERALARHSSQMHHKALFSFASQFLKEDGKLFVILPAALEKQAIDHAEKSGISLSRLIMVHPTPHKEYKRIILIFTRKETPKLEEEKLVIEMKRHVYSKKFYKLIKDFYLHPVSA